MRHLAGIILAASVLAGCNTTKPIEVVTTPAKLDVAQPADPRPPVLGDMHWMVVTKANLDEFIQKMSKSQDNSNPVFVALTMKDYEVLSRNLAEIKRYVDQQKSVIVYYRKATSK